MAVLASNRRHLCRDRFGQAVVEARQADLQQAEVDFKSSIALAEASGLSLLQPAHRFRSHASYALTQRRPASLVRETRFVEIGPLTLIKADVFDKLIPFPDSRWCYGIDLVWSEVLRRGGHRLGIVDGAPVEHLRPVALSYDIDSAIAEGQALMRRFDVQTSRAEFLSGDRIVIATR